MPDFSAFRVEVEDQLTAAVNAYYDTVERSAERDGLLAGILTRIDLLRARQALSDNLTALVEKYHILSGVLGNDEQALSDTQHWQVMTDIARARSYLAGFISAAPSMLRSQAVSRIVLYSAAIIQTASHVAGIGAGKPTLPIEPGDRSLACRGFCKCHLEWRTLPGNGNWDVFWVEDEAAEHCEDCNDLSLRWNPLQIRRGHIVSDRMAKVLADHHISLLLRDLGAI